MLQTLTFWGLDTSQSFAYEEQPSAAAMGVILPAWSRETQAQTDGRCTATLARCGGHTDQCTPSDSPYVCSQSRNSTL